MAEKKACLTFLGLPCLQFCAAAAQVPADLPDTATCVGLNRHVDYKGFDLLVSAYFAASFIFMVLPDNGGQ